MMLQNSPIGLFDSGVGGLTVLAAVRARLPGESIIYLGDTARLPYGAKSPATIRRYALQCAEKLVARHIKMLVVACNTASAVALPALAEAFPQLPVLGVVEPGAAAGCAASRSGRIAVIGTTSTIDGGAYQRAILKLRPEASMTALACPLFVPLAEEGLVTGPIAEAVAAHYLAPVFAGKGQNREGANANADAARPDCLVLGCTHFPLLKGVIGATVGPGVVLVDSAATTAAAVEEVLAGRNLRAASAAADTRFLTTDDPTRFARVGRLFLGMDISPADVELVDL